MTKKFVLVCENPEIKNLIQFLKLSKVKIYKLYLINIDRGESDDFSIIQKIKFDTLKVNNIKIISKNDFEQIIIKDQYTIILAHNECNNFIDIISYISKYHKQIKKYYHPVSFLKKSNFFKRFVKKTEYKHIITGFPGSGNIIYQKIFQEINIIKSKKFMIKKKEEYENLSKYFASLFHNTILNFVKEFLSKKTKKEIDYIVPVLVRNFIGFYYVKFKDDKNYSMINNIPIYQHLWEDHFVGQHGLNDKSFFSKFENIFYKQVYILRHPLDIITSNAGKIMMEITGERTNIVNLVNHKNYLLPMIDALINYLEILIKNRKDYIFLSYEDLIINPKKTISKVSNHLKMKLTNNEINKIQFKLLGKNLVDDQEFTSRNKKHFWNMEFNKYKKYIFNDNLNYIKKTRLNKLCDYFGYSIELKNNDQKMNDNFHLNKYQYDFAINEYKYYLNVNKKIEIKDKDVFFTLSDNNPEFCTNIKYAESFNSLMNTDLFKKGLNIDI